MAALRYVIILVCCMFKAGVAAGNDDSFSKMLKRIEALEEEQKESRSKIERLENVVTLQSGLIQSQADKIKALDEEAVRTKTLLLQTNRKTRSNSRKITALQHLLYETGFRKLSKDPSVVKTPKERHQPTPEDAKRPTNQTLREDSEVQTGGISRLRRQESAGVSFSVYLDHDADLGTHQTIKFNQAIINDGNAYNHFTGVFTCPEAGVYMFSFFIGERSETTTNTGAYAELNVNNQNVVHAVVDSFHLTQDLQGGNTVIKRLKQGDSVWIDSLGGHFEGRPGLKITTFSGVYLYP